MFELLPDGRSPQGKGENDEIGERDDVDGLSKEELEALKTNQSDTGEPVSAQAEANDQVEAWSVQWGSKNERPEEIIWPSDMGPPPIKLMVEAICQAAMTFPVDIGLGWDGIHPRAICRLSQTTLEWLAEVLYHCETTGEWPRPIGVVVIALLPKSDGGLRPIGLIPFLVRFWTRARRAVAMKWEKENQHPFLYAGKGVGLILRRGSKRPEQSLQPRPNLRLDTHRCCWIW